MTIHLALLLHAFLHSGVDARLLATSRGSRENIRTMNLQVGDHLKPKAHSIGGLACRLKRSMGLSKSDCSSSDKTSPEKCENVFWLHFPKCGSSFSLTLRLSHCSRNPQKRYFHMPLPEDVDVDTVVALFRQPDQRLASATNYFLDEALRDPNNGIDWGLNKNTTAIMQEHLKKGSTPANDKWLGKSFLGCQTNMMVGRHCWSGTPTSIEEDVKKASDRLKKMKFVGLFEEWSLSACLFNYKATGRRFIDDHQLVNTRPTLSKNGSTEYDTKGYPQDDADSRLYEEAKRRFYDDIQQNDISPDTCSFDSKGNPISFELFRRARLID